jgi:hypothetical protein
LETTLRRALRVLLLVAMLGSLGSLIGVSDAAAAVRLPAAGSGTPPVPTSSISPDPQANRVTYCVDNYAPNSTVSVTNQANGETGSIHTDANGHGCTHIPVKTDCSQSVNNTIVASGTDQAGKPASSQATYNAPPDSSKCASPKPTPTRHCDPSQATLSVYVVEQGATVTGSACGFTPSETVAGFIHSQPVFIGDTAATEDGSAVMSGPIPTCIEPGQHTFTLEGETSGRVASASFTVTPSEACSRTALPAGGILPGIGGTGGGGGLAFTGANIAALVVAALLLLVVGTLLVATVRRRRTATAA